MRSFKSVVVAVCLFYFTVVNVAAFAAVTVRFAPPVRYAAGTQPKRVAVADLNGDGKLDIVASSETDQAIYVLLGKGDGTFLPAVRYATAGASPMGIAIADFTGDGKLDIGVATANYGGSFPAYFVLPGNGNGTFGAAIVTRDPNVSPLAITAGDFNEDGKIDLLIASNGSSGIAFGNGDGTFHTFTALPPSSTTLDNPWAATSADVNRDGHLDVITGSYAGNVSVYLGNGDGTFKTPVTLSVFDASYQGITSVAAADVNGDGWPDIVVAGSNSNAVELLLNNGNGTFTVPANVGALNDPMAYYGGTNPTGIVFADFNADGRLDIAFPDYNLSQGPPPADNYGITVLTGTTSGLFDPSSLRQFDAGNHAGQAAVGDFNGDGLPDIVTADAQDNAISVLINGAAVNVALTASPKPALPGQSITLSAHVQGSSASGAAPTGTVTFMNVANVLGSAPLDASGNASITTSFSTPSAGYQIDALYSGDANHTGSSDTMFEQVGYPTTTTINSSASSPVPVSSTVTLSATVNSPFGSPTGFIYFYDGSTQIGRVTYASGTVTLTTPPLTGGTHVFRAQYVRDSTSATAGFLSSNATVTVGVGAATTLSLSGTTSAKPGANVTVTATLTGTGGTPTGSVSILDGTTVIATVTLANGTAQFVTNTLSIGAHSLTAQYIGDATFAPSTSAAMTVQILAPPTVTVTVPASAKAGASVVLSAGVTGQYGTPTGTITFFDGTTSLGTSSLAGGVANLTVSSFTAGSHSLTATYGGDAVYTNGASAAVSVSLQYGTTLSLTAPASATAGSTITLSATVTATSGTPSGTVSFADNGTPVGTATLSNGAASFAIQNIAAGSHTFTATYSGDATNATSTTSTAPVTSATPDFSVTLPSSPALTVKAGSSATLSITVAPQPGGFTSPVQFTCSGLPSQATCSFSPATVTPGNSPATTTLTVSTVAPSSQRPAGSLALFLATILPLGSVLAGAGASRRRKIVLGAILLCLAVLLIACGGSNSSSTTPVTHNPGTAAGTYTVTVSAQSGQTTHSSTLTLTVQ